MEEYKKLDYKASEIITKLKNYINKNGYYENLGVKEERNFCELVDKSNLSYMEKSQLKEMFDIALNNL